MTEVNTSPTELVDYSSKARSGRDRVIIKIKDYY